MQITAFTFTLSNRSGGTLTLDPDETTPPKDWSEPPPKEIKGGTAVVAADVQEGGGQWQANYDGSGQVYGFSFAVSQFGHSFTPRNSKLENPALKDGLYSATVVFETAGGED